MKVIALIAFFIAGACAQYGIPDDEPLERMDSYSAPVMAPLPVIRSTYSEPAPVRMVSSYAAPAPVRTVFSSYEAPAPVRTVVSSYEAPAPVRTVVSSYEAPAPVRMVSSYEAPAPVRMVSSYEAPIVRKAIVPIVELKVDNDNYGTYSVKSISGDGTSSVESAVLKNLGGAEGPVSVSSGQYSFVSDDGKTYTTTWTADENGFHATGDHLPTSPPVPAEIQRSLVENSYGSSYAAPAVRLVAPVVRSSY